MNKVKCTSDWSNTQTMSIPDSAVSTAAPSPTSSNPTTAPTSTPTPSVPEFSWLMIPLLFLSMLSIVVLIRKRKFLSQKQTIFIENFYGNI
jgi:hypothetical protein